MSLIKSLTVVNKGNEKSRLTITSDNDVRIKIGRNISKENTQIVVDKLTTIAENTIQKNLNTLTLRASVPDELSFNRLSLKTNTKPKKSVFVYL